MKKATKNMLLVVAILAVAAALFYVVNKRRVHHGNVAPKYACDFVVSQMQMVGPTTAAVYVEAHAPVKIGDQFVFTNLPQDLPLYGEIFGLPLPITDVGPDKDNTSQTILQVTLQPDAIASMPAAPSSGWFFSGCGSVLSGTSSA
jgi:hypothetical protein